VVTHRNRPASVGYKYRAARPPEGPIDRASALSPRGVFRPSYRCQANVRGRCPHDITPLAPKMPAYIEASTRRVEVSYTGPIGPIGPPPFGELG